MIKAARTRHANSCRMLVPYFAALVSVTAASAFSIFIFRRKDAPPGRNFGSDLPESVVTEESPAGKPDCLIPCLESEAHEVHAALPVGEQAENAGAMQYDEAHVDLINAIVDEPVHGVELA